MCCVPRLRIIEPLHQRITGWEEVTKEKLSRDTNPFSLAYPEKTFNNHHSGGRKKRNQCKGTQYNEKGKAA
jgi:hypothetical protein